MIEQNGLDKFASYLVGVGEEKHGAKQVGEVKEAVGRTFMVQKTGDLLELQPRQAFPLVENLSLGGMNGLVAWCKNSERFLGDGQQGFIREKSDGSLAAGWPFAIEEWERRNESRKPFYWPWEVKFSAKTAFRY